MFIAGKRIFITSSVGAECTADAAPTGAKSDLTLSNYKHFAPLALVFKGSFPCLNFSRLGQAINRCIVRSGCFDKGKQKPAKSDGGNMMPVRLLRAFIFLVILHFVNLQSLQAQSELPKLEWGVQFSTLRLSDFAAWDKGMGSRLTYNINRRVSLEGEVNVFFSDRTSSPIFIQPFFVGERKTQALFGVKAGARSNRLGFFGKLRPGFINFSVGSCQGVLIGNNCFGNLLPGSNCRDANGNVIACPQSLTSTTKFALDMGGVIEFYPSRRFAVRFDIGDTLIRNSLPGQTSHNLQISSGLSLRF